MYPVIENHQVSLIVILKGEHANVVTQPIHPSAVDDDNCQSHQVLVQQNGCTCSADWNETCDVESFGFCTLLCRTASKIRIRACCSDTEFLIGNSTGCGQSHAVLLLLESQVPAALLQAADDRPCCACLQLPSTVALQTSSKDHAYTNLMEEPMVHVWSHLPPPTSTNTH